MYNLLVSGLLFQPTLPQGERRQYTMFSPAREGISTHAPARGATQTNQGLLWVQGISTHAPARGATGKPTVIRKITKQFQPTLPQGERLIPMEIKSPILLFQPTLPQGERLSTTYPTDVYLDISTHAPARGATPSTVK